MNKTKRISGLLIYEEWNEKIVDFEISITDESIKNVPQTLEYKGIYKLYQSLVENSQIEDELRRLKNDLEIEDGRTPLVIFTKVDRLDFSRISCGMFEDYNSDELAVEMKVPSNDIKDIISDFYTDGLYSLE